MDVMSREQILEFLQNHVKTDMLMKHLCAVESGRRGQAAKQPPKITKVPMCWILSRS